MRVLRYERLSGIQGHQAYRPVVTLLCLFAVVAGLLLPMTATLAGTQDGDGALTSLISTQKLTWYFWGQDRLLNLLPALAAPFRDPETNLHVQVFLRAALSFLSPLGVICLFRGGVRKSLAIVALSQCVMALALSPYGAFNMWVQHNPCGTSLVLFALAVWFAQAGGVWRGGIGFLVLFLAYAVNIALVLWSLPFLALGIVFGIRDRRWLLGFVAANVGALALAWMHGHWFGESATRFAVHPSLDAILAGYRSLSAEVDIRIMLGLFAIALAAGIYRRSRETTMALCVAMGMVVAVGAISCLDWLQTNVFNIRYFLTFITVFVSCCVYVVLKALPDRVLRPAPQAALATVLGAVMFFVGMGGLSATPLALMDARWRAPAETAAQVAIDAHASLIVGDFWDVWPAVMDARSDLRDQGRFDEPLYGAAFRGHVLRKKMNGLFDRHPEGVLALCLEAVVSECGPVATANAQLSPAVVADGASSRKVSVGGKPAYLVLLRRPQ